MAKMLSKKMVRDLDDFWTELSLWCDITEDGALQYGVFLGDLDCYEFDWDYCEMVTENLAEAQDFYDFYNEEE